LPIDLTDTVAVCPRNAARCSIGLKEARHDLGVAAALLAEEQGRVDALNARRAAILSANVGTVVFRRARRAGRVRVVPPVQAAAALAGGICLKEHPAVPEEIHRCCAMPGRLVSDHQGAARSDRPARCSARRAHRCAAQRRNPAADALSPRGRGEHASACCARLAP
jgi:hypothetical protein